MGIYGDFHPYKIMHFISHSLHLFHGGEGKPYLCNAPPFYSFHFYFQKDCGWWEKSQIYIKEKQNCNIILKELADVLFHIFSA